MPTFYDTHAHLDYPDFANELPEVIVRAQAAGIARIITIGTDLESSRRALKLTQQFENVYAVVGWHPSYAGQAPDDFRPSLRDLARQPKVVALGETGLDYHRLPGRKTPVDADAATTSAAKDQDDLYKKKQADLFRQHLEVAAELGLNCVIHQRDALEDTLAQFQPLPRRVGALFFCVANVLDAMRGLVELGSFRSFTSMLTFKSGKNIRDTLAATPLDKFMLETDCPFLAPLPYRGKRCEPAYVKEISEATAQVKGCSLETLSTATCETAQSFFKGI